MNRYAMKRAWELLCIVCIALPVGVVAYFILWGVNGWRAAQTLHANIHNPE